MHRFLKVDHFMALFLIAFWLNIICHLFPYSRYSLLYCCNLYWRSLVKGGNNFMIYEIYFILNLKYFEWNTMTRLKRILFFAIVLHFLTYCVLCTYRILAYMCNSDSSEKGIREWSTRIHSARIMYTRKRFSFLTLPCIKDLKTLRKGLG